MCGIAGEFARRQPADIGSVRRMTDALAHRGPDSEGYFFQDHVALGFRRLSIIDLAGGDQPIFNEDRRLCIILNGEIYNYKELARLLPHHQFRTHTDTEVALHLFEERGVEAFGMLNGMFALAIYDNQQDVLYCARDRFGQKPFHYYHNPESGFVFASDIDALRLHSRVPTVFDQTALAFYWFYNYIPAPRSVFRGMSKLPPQSYLRVDQSGVHLSKYALSPAVSDQTVLEWPDVVARADDLLRSAVRRHLIADVDVGLFLSGGLDSTLVLKYAAEENPNIATYSVTFTPHVSERVYMQQACDKYGVWARVVDMQPNVADIENALAAYSEPFGDGACVPTWLLSRYAAQQVKAVLTGEGGDEIFGGYNEYSRLLAGGGEGIRQPLKERYLPSRAFCSLDQLRDDYVTDTVPLAAHLNALRLEKVGDVLLHEQTQRLPDNHFTKVDTASMAHSLEARCPFLDHPLADFANALPLEAKVTARERKRILRAILLRDFPPEFVDRPKWGFGAPVEAWISMTPLREQLACVLREEDANLRRLATPAYREKLLSRVKAGLDVRLYYEHWKVYALLVWLREKGIAL